MVASTHHFFLEREPQRVKPRQATTTGWQSKAGNVEDQGLNLTGEGFRQLSKNREDCNTRSLSRANT